MTDPGPVPRCHLYVTADCYGDCDSCPFGVLQKRPAPDPEPEPLRGVTRFVDRVRAIGYVVLLVVILGVLLWHVVTR